MSAASGTTPPSAAGSDVSAFERIANARRASRARLQQDAPVTARPSAAVTPEPVPTVTLDKIGDFLELDFRRLFVWLRAGLVLALMLAVAGGVIGAAYGLLSKQRYTVTTEILINPANLQVVENDVYSQPGQVDSQILNARSKQ
ncbi:MAG: lipopolysaccharide biosynthesis protein, partial [Mesorhizobium sp.]